MNCRYHGSLPHTAHSHSLYLAVICVTIVVFSSNCTMKSTSRKKPSIYRNYIDAIDVAIAELEAIKCGMVLDDFIETKKPLAFVAALHECRGTLECIAVSLGDTVACNEPQECENEQCALGGDDDV